MIARIIALLVLGATTLFAGNALKPTEVQAEPLVPAQLKNLQGRDIDSLSLLIVNFADANITFVPAGTTGGTIDPFEQHILDLQAASNAESVSQTAQSSIPINSSGSGLVGIAGPGLNNPSVNELQSLGSQPSALFSSSITIGGKDYSLSNYSNLNLTNFGGPNDGFGIKEAKGYGGSGLAYNTKDKYPSLFLPPNDPSVLAAQAKYGTTNDFMRLDQSQYYVATRSGAAGAIVIVENPKTGEWVAAVNVDSGPQDPTRADTSLGVQKALGLEDGGKVNMYFAEDQGLKPGTTGKDGTIIDKPEDTTTDNPPVDDQGTQPNTGSTGSSGGFIGNVACGGAPWCSIPRYCYKYGGPPVGKGLFEPVLTCNGGFKLIGKVVVKIVDCGPYNSIGCNPKLTPKNYACLWQTCKGKNAIWDMDTLKCGCDLGPSTGGGGGDSKKDETPPPAEETKDTEPLEGSTNQERLDNFNQQQEEAGTNARIVVKDGANIADSSPEAVERAATLARNCDCEVRITAGVRLSAQTHGVGGANIDITSSPEVVDYIKNNTDPDRIYDAVDRNGNFIGKAYVIDKDGLEYVHETEGADRSEYTAEHVHVRDISAAHAADVNNATTITSTNTSAGNVSNATPNITTGGGATSAPATVPETVVQPNEQYNSELRAAGLNLNSGAAEKSGYLTEEAYNGLIKLQSELGKNNRQNLADIGPGYFDIRATGTFEKLLTNNLSSIEKWFAPEVTYTNTNTETSATIYKDGKSATFTRVGNVWRTEF
ncbi:MAG: hypothetical protein Q8Q18_00045 [bacterium]|nr:hypothetical protein [bacterium]